MRHGWSVGLLFALVLMPAAASAAALAPASALGPEVAITEASNGFVGTLEAAPENGPVGTPVSISGTALPADAELDLVWRTMKGAWKTEDGEYHGREYTPVAYRIATVRTDATGAFSADFVVPEDFGFQHDIVIQQGDRLLTQTGFTIDLSMKVTPERGPVGTPMTVEIKGIGWRDLENSWMLVYDNSFTGWTSAVATAGSARFTIPATGAVGMHVLRMVHGVFTFPYLNPEQNPYPDRPRPHAEFEITAGDAVLPPAPEAQLQATVRGLPPAGDLTVTPAFAGVGTPVTVEASGLESGKTYALNWSTVTGNRIAQNSWEKRLSVVAEAAAGADGKARFAFAVPDDLGGAHDLSVTAGDKELAGSFWVTPSAVSFAQQRVPAGTTITVNVKGVGWTETANIYHINYDNAYLGYACGFNSQGDITVHLVASGEPGWHFVDLYPGIYKGKESRPNNFRIPQLTYADDHPGEDLPAFRFAIYVTAPDEAQN